MSSRNGHAGAMLELRDVHKHFTGADGEPIRAVDGVSPIENAALKLIVEGVPRRTARATVAPLLERLDLAGRADELGIRLSVGERQRVALARALANEPRLILADEPTGSLDTRRGREVLALLADLCHERGIATVLVTHDPTGAGYADRVH